jgi:hypothetical protein
MRVIKDCDNLKYAQEVLIKAFSRKLKTRSSFATSSTN